jgi:hypothetical protein
MVERNLRVRLSDEDMNHSKAYAERNGLRMLRAYAELIRVGLDASPES